MAMQGATAPRLEAAQAEQEIADLKEALANLEKGHETLLEEYSTLERELEEAKADLANSELERESLQGEVDKLERECSELENKIEDLELHPAGADDIRDLIRIRETLKKGERAVGLVELDRVLDRLDDCWQTVGTGAPLL